MCMVLGNVSQVYRCLYKICAHSNPNSQNQNSSGTSPSPPQSSSAIEKEKLNVLSYICSLAACGEVRRMVELLCNSLQR